MRKKMKNISFKNRKQLVKFSKH